MAEHQRVFRAVYAFCGDRETAEDSTQEGFSRALARWRRLRQERWTGAWVTTVAINACKKSLKRSKRVQIHSPRASSNPDEVVDRHDLVRALRNLPLRQREAVVLHYLTDSPVADVAEMMNLSEGSVKTHLARARAALRESLEDVDV